MIRVMIADDHPVVLEGLKLVLDAERDIEVVATTPSNVIVSLMSAKLLRCTEWMKSSVLTTFAQALNT